MRTNSYFLRAGRHPLVWQPLYRRCYSTFQWHGEEVSWEEFEHESANGSAVSSQSDWIDWYEQFRQRSGAYRRPVILDPGSSMSHVMRYHANDSFDYHELPSVFWHNRGAHYDTIDCPNFLVLSSHSRLEALGVNWMWGTDHVLACFMLDHMGLRWCDEVTIATHPTYTPRIHKMLLDSLFRNSPRVYSVSAPRAIVAELMASSPTSTRAIPSPEPPHTALVVHIGHRFAYVAAVVNGRVLRHYPLQVTGEVLSLCVRYQPDEQRLDHGQPWTTDIMQRHLAKESYCRVPLGSFEKKLAKQSSVKTVFGFSMSARDQLLPGEALFRPSLLNFETLGVVDATKLVVLESPPEAQELLWRNVLLSGGTTTMTGFVERFTRDLQALAPVSGIEPRLVPPDTVVRGCARLSLLLDVDRTDDRPPDYTPTFPGHDIYG